MAEKKGLGRGLSSLLSDSPKAKAAAPAPEDKAEIEELMAGMRELPIEYISANKKQPRVTFDDQKLKELAESIKDRGILQPILVRPLGGPNQYEIVAGERRWRAAQLARLDKVPAIIRELSDQETFEIAIVENVQRADLNPIEEGAGFRRLMDEFGYTQDALSKVIGKSRTHIANTLRLLDLPEKVRNLVINGDLTQGHAKLLVGMDNAIDIAALIIEENMSVRQAENFVREAKGGKPKKPGPSAVPSSKNDGYKDPDTRALERDIEAMLGLKVSVDPKTDETGTVTITYKSLDQFDDLLARFRYKP